MESPFSFPLRGEAGLVPLGLDLPGKCLRATSSRRKREFMPDEKKDASYWEKRKKNNEAAKRSREKRRVSDYVLEAQLAALSDENMRLRAELLALRLRLGLQWPGAPHHQGAGLLPPLPLPLPLPAPAPAPNVHPLPPRTLPSHAERDVCWGGGGSAEGGASYQSPVPKPAPVGSAFTPPRSTVRRGYPYFFDKYAPFPPAHHVPFLLPTLLPPNPSASWGGPAPPRPGPGPKVSSEEEEEEEQQVPAASECDPRSALPHKLRLKGRGLPGRDPAASPPATKLHTRGSEHRSWNTEHC
ncbi:nuclear factor interleukin-3-regulated protein-like [Anguilla anguilla]|uniref:nuclear factor interleukin-3-regulated protein-like n=1 Tax=Anguilla anguilla TaxID=7936 RepID=UPI0015AAE0EF|nr:nuclear factor interleukin-3-regulated protein-like [Anguilla anguilla]